MAQLSDQQIRELNIAQTRVNQGQGTETDIKNLEFAKTKGFTPSIGESSTIKPVSTNQVETVTTTPTTPVKLDVEPAIPEDVFNQPPTTANEISQRLLDSQQRQETQTQTFLDEMKSFQKQQIEATKPTSEETQLITDINDINQQARELRASFKTGVDKITGQSIPMSLAYGQTRELENQVNRRLEALSLTAAPLVDTLQTLQSAREVKLSQLQILSQFARDNFALLQNNNQANRELQMKIFEIQQEEQRYKKQEQQQAKEFAFENNITAPYYEAAGIIYNTQTGEPEYRQVGKGIETLDGSIKFTNPEQFFKHSGLSTFEQIQKTPTKGESEERELVKDLALKYPDAGISLDDNFAEAQAKLDKSKIYQEQVRPPVSLSRGSSSSSEDVIPTNINEAVSIAAEQLIEMRDSGTLNDLVYDQYIQGLMADWGVNPEREGDLRSTLNRAMERASYQNVGSDFVTETPTTNDILKVQATISSPETAKNEGKQKSINEKADEYKKQAEELLRIINSLAFNESAKSKAKKKLAKIPKNYEGINIY